MERGLRGLRGKNADKKVMSGRKVDVVSMDLDGLHSFVSIRTRLTKSDFMNHFTGNQAMNLRTTFKHGVMNAKK